MNSDEDRDVDIESDEDDDGEGGSNISTQFMTQAERRAHHNALERKRRDHIKESFHGLRDCVPSMQGDKASRAQILKQATDYIQFMSKKNGGHQKDIDDLKKQNTLLESQIRGLERAKATGAFAAQSALDGGGPSKSGAQSTNYHDEESGEESSDTESTGQSRRKKIKTSTK